jgi:hypothetical protein
MRRQFTRISAISALGFATALVAASLCGNVYAQNGPSGVAPADTAAFGQQNHGNVMCTASVNSDGSVAGGESVIKTSITRVGVGEYNVKFNPPCNGNIKVSNGWARWTQVDTLAFGTINGYCTTADLFVTSGVGGVWVSCFAPSGAQQDTSFNLFVAR